MNNADMPAMPTRDAIVDCGPDGSSGPHMVPVDFGGLTKREHFAAMAMQGMLAHSTRYKPRDQDSHLHWHEALGREACDIADALLAELEKAP